MMRLVCSLTDVLAQYDNLVLRWDRTAVVVV
jgi:hypothetical protein